MIKLTAQKWYCHCCSKQNEPGVEHCIVCGRHESYAQEGYVLPLNGIGAKVYRPSQVPTMMSQEEIYRTDGFLFTALHNAAAGGNAPMVQELLVQDSNVNGTTEHGLSPLHLAVYAGSLECVQLLIKKGADVNLASKTEKMTPMHFAAKYGHRNIARTLFEYGAKVDPLNIMQRTPLHFAAETGRNDVGQYLLKSGANPDALDVHGWPPRALAELYGHRRFQEILVLSKMTDKQPVLKYLPPANWHGELWDGIISLNKEARYKALEQIKREQTLQAEVEVYDSIQRQLEYEEVDQEDTTYAGMKYWGAVVRHAKQDAAPRRSITIYSANSMQTYSPKKGHYGPSTDASMEVLERARLGHIVEVDSRSRPGSKAQNDRALDPFKKIKHGSLQEALYRSTSREGSRSTSPLAMSPAYDRHRDADRGVLDSRDFAHREITSADLFEKHLYSHAPRKSHQSIQSLLGTPNKRQGVGKHASGDFQDFVAENSTLNMRSIDESAGGRQRGRGAMGMEGVERGPFPSTKRHDASALKVKMVTGDGSVSPSKMLRFDRSADSRADSGQSQSRSNSRERDSRLSIDLSRLQSPAVTNVSFEDYEAPFNSDAPLQMIKFPSSVRSSAPSSPAHSRPVSVVSTENARAAYGKAMTDSFNQIRSEWQSPRSPRRQKRDNVRERDDQAIATIMMEADVKDTSSRDVSRPGSRRDRQQQLRTAAKTYKDGIKNSSYKSIRFSNAGAAEPRPSNVQFGESAAISGPASRGASRSALKKQPTSSSDMRAEPNIAPDWAEIAKINAMRNKSAENTPRTDRSTANMEEAAGRTRRITGTDFDAASATPRTGDRRGSQGSASVGSSVRRGRREPKADPKRAATFRELQSGKKQYYIPKSLTERIIVGNMLADQLAENGSQTSGESSGPSGGMSEKRGMRLSIGSARQAGAATRALTPRSTSQRMFQESGYFPTKKHQSDAELDRQFDDMLGSVTTLERFGQSDASKSLAYERESPRRRMDLPPDSPRKQLAMADPALGYNKISAAIRKAGVRVVHETK